MKNNPLNSVLLLLSFCAIALLITACSCEIRFETYPSNNTQSEETEDNKQLP